MRGRWGVVCLASVAAWTASPAHADPVLVSTSTINDGNGYGGYAWTGFTADLNAATAGTVATTADLSDPAGLLGYDGIWVDVRQTTLSADETTALSAYVATGRRLVLVGGNAAAFGTWNGSILNLVGGTDGGPLTPAATPSAVAIVPLTGGVSSIYATGGDVAVGGTSLFSQRVATVWGPANNVVVLLNDNLPSDDQAKQAGNAAFTNNLAQWVAGGLPDPTSLWQQAGGGSWQSGSNWLANAMPAVADSAVFNLSSGYTVGVAAPVTARNLTVASDRLTLDFTTATAGLTVGSALTVGSSNRSTATLTLTHSLGTGVATLSAGTVVVGSAGALSIGAGTRLAVGGTLSAAGPVTVAGQLAAALGSMSSLTIAGTLGHWTGQVDVGGGDLVVTGGDLSTLTNQVAQGYDGGKWDGNGITSSAAAADGRHLVAVGITPDGTGVELRATLVGDANLDGVVNAADMAAFETGLAGHLTGWANGDFNYDGAVDQKDYDLMEAAMASGATAAPEPAVGSALMLPMAAWLGRRRRRWSPVR